MNEMKGLFIFTLGLLFAATTAQNYPNQLTEPCNGRANGFARDLGSCNHYYFCQNGNGVRGVCSNNRLFDGERELCVNANNRPCFECNRNNPFQLTSVPNACHQYIQCFNQRPTLHRCPLGLVYDGRRSVQQCNVPPPHGGCYREESDDQNPALPRCPQVTNRPVYLRDRNSCSVYYVCTGSPTPQRRQCSTGLHFNLQVGVCDRPEAANCPNPLPPNPPPPGNPQPGPAYPCTGQAGEFIPDRARCNYYHICLPSGSTQEDQCSGRLLFDANSKQCRIPTSAVCFTGAAIPGFRDTFSEESIDDEVNGDEESLDDAQLE